MGVFDKQRREILRATPPRIQLVIEGLPRAADAGDPGMRNLVNNGVVERCSDELRTLASAMADVERVLVSG